MKLEGSFAPEVGTTARHATETELDNLADDAWDLILPPETTVEARVRLIAQRLQQEAA